MYSPKRKIRISPRINLSIDEEFEEILIEFRKRFPLLKEVDIIKMCVSGYYVEHYDQLFSILQDPSQQ